MIARLLVSIVWACALSVTAFSLHGCATPCAVAGATRCAFGGVEICDGKTWTPFAVCAKIMSRSLAGGWECREMAPDKAECLPVDADGGLVQ